jgi:putative phosphoribosyl transferase
MRFDDRAHAGRLLAAALAHLAPTASGDRPVVLALPRGGVPVAAAVADALGAPLDVLLVRKLGAPSQPELAIGAIGEGGVEVRNARLIGALGLDEATIRSLVERERATIDRGRLRFRHGRDLLDLRGRTVIVVDDGLATGATARAALEVVRAAGARHVVLAVPVAAPDSLHAASALADESIVLHAPASFGAVGGYYRDFSQVTDAEVADLLRVG